LKLDDSHPKINHFLLVIYGDKNINPGFFARLLKILGIPSKDEIEKWRQDIIKEVGNEIVAHQLKSPSEEDINAWTDYYEKSDTKSPSFQTAIKGNAGKMPHYDIRTLYTKHFSST
jgi:hypothetical protein